jgi:hypothetical protein
VTDPRPEQVYYTEDHIARNVPLVIAGFWAPITAIAAIVLAITLYKVPGLTWVFLAIMALAILTWLILKGELLRYTGPSSIRIDSTGVRIGGARRAERHPGSALPQRKTTVPWQCAQVFACPWDGITRIGVTRNPKVLKALASRAKYGDGITPLGNLAVPFMDAALVLWIDLDRATLPEIRRARGFLRVFGGWTSRGYHQPLWIAPTRQPEKLATALAEVPFPWATADDPFSDSDENITFPEFSM